VKCRICDKEITEKEIQWNPDYEEWEPCPVCLEIAFDAAYSDGFRGEDEEVVVEDEFDGLDYPLSEVTFLSQRIYDDEV
jgi:hypothetical protein